MPVPIDSHDQALAMEEGRSVPPPNHREAIWVWTDEVASDHRRYRLIDDLVGQGYTTVYINVYRPERSSDNRKMYEDEDVAALISLANEFGMEVWAAYGNPDWVDLGVEAGSPPKNRFDEILEYNRLHPHVPFAGIILDVEPPEPIDLSALLRFYGDATEYLNARGLSVATAIRYFWKDAVTAPSGRVEEAHKSVIRMDFDHVVVMGYRNYAGAPVDDNGLISANRDHIAYASAIDHHRKVLVGLRTTSTLAEGGHWIETFHGYPASSINREKAAVKEYFKTQAGFGGFATHRYEPAGSEPGPVLAANF